ncbi:hypothetical protein ABS71_11605 [bacterium SCN 62-11]|nr:MAG: hypothetical protein ABS71_11605 [bacterium SCN 62-11]
MPVMPVLVFLLAFGVFGWTAAPSVGPGHDSGELTVAAYCLGVAHPPGYPLFVRLAHLWGGLWGGDYGWRINLFSGFCTALAAGLLADLVRRATGSAAATLVAGLGFAFLGSVWGQAVIAEVFGLHFAITMGLGWLGWRVLEHPEEKRWLWAFYACLGLGLAHHHTFVLALPGLLWMAWPHWRRVLLTPAWAATVLVALVLYTDMWWRAQGEPGLNWGGLRSFDDVLGHFLRRSYGTFRLTNKPDGLEHGVVHGAAYVLFTYARQAPLVWVLLAIWGGLLGGRRQAGLWRLGWGWLIAFGPFFALIGRQRLDTFHLDMLERFYASSYLGLALLAGLGTAELARRIGARRALLLAALLLGWQFRSNLPACRLDGRELVASYGRQLLDNCKPGSLLVVTGDLPVGALAYVQQVEGYRTEVPVVCKGLYSALWFQRGLPAWVQPYAAGRPKVEDLARAFHEGGLPVFTTLRNELPGETSPRRLGWEWLPQDRSGRTEVECLRSELADAERLRPGLGRESRFWPLFMISTRLANLRALAGAIYVRDSQLALAALDLVVELGDGRSLDLLNRGLLRQRLGRHREAIEDFQKCPELELTPLALIYSQTCLALSDLKI